MKKKVNSGLCKKCSEMVFTLMATTCHECKIYETNTRFKRCGQCAVTKNQCAYCDAKLLDVPQWLQEPFDKVCWNYKEEFLDLALSGEDSSGFCGHAVDCSKCGGAVDEAAKISIKKLEEGTLILRRNKDK